MNKLLIEGINGSLELNKKYIYLVINEQDKSHYEEHVVWFNEIESIVYKKPTKYKYGYISLVLFYQGIIRNKKAEYKIILNKIDEKSIESSNYIYKFIKGVVENKEVKVFEEVDKVEPSKEEPNLVSEKKEIILEEIKKIVEENNQQVESLKEKPDIDLKVKKDSEKPIEKKDIPTINMIPKTESIIDIKQEKKEEKKYIEEDIDVLENDIDDDFIEEEKQEDKPLKSVYSLEKKLYDLENDLQTITYKNIILSNFVDTELERKKIDKLIIEIKKLIEKIEKIKKEILKQEKNINEDNYIKLDNGNVTILSIKKSLLEEKELNNYITQYKDVITKLDIVQKETNELKDKSEKKKKEIGISNEDYDRMVNQFQGVKTNKEFASKLIKETKERLSKVKWRIESSIEQKTKYKYVRKSISDQTKRLAALTALNEIRPKRSKLSMIALSLFTGISSIHDLLGYDIKKVEYNEIVQKEFLEGLDYLETSKTRTLIDSSKEEIEGILSECEKKYSSYPGFKSLQKKLESLKKEIEAQDKELGMLEDKINDYNKEPKMKVLRHVA